MNFDDEDLVEVQTIIENMLNDNDFDDVIISADCNWHRGRNTGFAAAMERWVKSFLSHILIYIQI